MFLSTAFYNPHLSFVQQVLWRNSVLTLVKGRKQTPGEAGVNPVTLSAADTVPHHRKIRCDTPELDEIQQQNLPVIQKQGFMDSKRIKKDFYTSFVW